MSAAALFILVLSTGQPVQAPSMESEADRTPMRCRPAPYYVAEQAARPKAERMLVTGSRVPLIRDEERRPRPPCLLMRYDGPPNPLRPAD